jgi:hypothetical protein
MATLATEHQDVTLARAMAKCADDPLRFVRIAYPWGEPGPLREYAGPDAWQEAFLIDLGNEVKRRGFDGIHAVEPIREAASSGHGIGKSTMAAWLADWILSTRPYSQGTVTSNTFSQLQSKTWAAIQRWTRLCITGHWFHVGADRIMAKAAPESWFCTAQTCREENSEAFAGQHAANSTSWYLFDEASAIPDRIWEVAEGGLTDGEPMIFAWGNPTRSTGKFHRVCFGSERARWKQRIIDSRDSAFTNKALIAQWIADYGEDSDFVRVRVRGLPPKASDLQYIDQERVYNAQRRPAAHMADDPLVVGLDVARGGGDDNVLRFRRGLDAHSIPAIRIPGEEARDSMRVVTVLLDVLAREYGGQKPAVAFVDGTGIGGPIVDRCQQMGFRNVVEVQFGARAPDRHYANMRAFMWSRMRDWLARGSIDSDPQLEQDLTGPGYSHDKQDRLVLESKESMKKRGLDSPDDADALALTFAAPVGPKKEPAHRVRTYDPARMAGSWMS